MYLPVWLWKSYLGVSTVLRRLEGSYWGEFLYEIDSEGSLAIMKDTEGIATSANVLNAVDQKDTTRMKLTGLLTAGSQGFGGEEDRVPCTWWEVRLAKNKDIRVELSLTTHLRLSGYRRLEQNTDNNDSVLRDNVSCLGKVRRERAKPPKVWRIRPDPDRVNVCFGELCWLRKRLWTVSMRELPFAYVGPLQQLAGRESSNNWVSLDWRACRPLDEELSQG